MARIVFKSRIEAMILHSGELIYINQYKEFNEYIKQYSNTDFAKHYTLFKNQTGVYRFNVNDKPHYVGYSQNLFDRVRKSFFNTCMGFNNVTFQYILCDTQFEAMEIEAHYIKLLQPFKNQSGRNLKRDIDTNINILPFCNEMEIHFNTFYPQSNYINIPPKRIKK